MKKIRRMIVLTLFGALIALNVTSNLQINIAGGEVQASDGVSIPCYSAFGDGDFGDRFVYCLTCKEKKGRERGDSGNCTPGDIVEN